WGNSLRGTGGCVFERGDLRTKVYTQAQPDAPSGQTLLRFLFQFWIRQASPVQLVLSLAPLLNGKLGGRRHLHLGLVGPAQLLQDLSADEMHGAVVRILLLGGINFRQRLFVSFAAQVNPCQLEVRTPQLRDDSQRMPQIFLSQRILL